MTYPLYNPNNYYPPHSRPAEERMVDEQVERINMHRMIEGKMPITRLQLQRYQENLKSMQVPKGAGLRGGSDIGHTIASVAESILPLAHLLPLLL